MRLTWLADVLHAAHLQLVPLDGWQGRGRELQAVNAVILHHTATPKTTLDANVAKILRDGRADLPGPLSQLGLDRQGRYWLIADGKCNHNIGEYGNQTVGIEALNDGRGEAWPAVQIDAFQRGTAAILRHLGLNEGHALGHREVDPGRKIDPRGVDLEAFRRRVAQLLRPTVEDDEMRYPADKPYLPLTIGSNGQGTIAIPVAFADITSVTVKANDNWTHPDARVLPTVAQDGKSTVLSAVGKPGTVGVIVGYRG